MYLPDLKCKNQKPVNKLDSTHVQIVIPFHNGLTQIQDEECDSL